MRWGRGSIRRLCGGTNLHRALPGFRTPAARDATHRAPPDVGAASPGSGGCKGVVYVSQHTHTEFVARPPCTLEKIVFTNTMQFAVATTPMLATRAAVRPQASRAALVVRAEDVKPVMIGLAVGSSIISPAGIRSAVPGGGVCPTHGYRRRGHVVESFACSLHPPRIHRARSSADSDD